MLCDLLRTVGDGNRIIEFCSNELAVQKYVKAVEPHTSCEMY